MGITIVDIRENKVVLEKGNKLQNVFGIRSIDKIHMDAVSTLYSKSKVITQKDRELILKLLSEKYEVIEVKAVDEEIDGKLYVHYIIYALPVGSYRKYVQFKYVFITDIYNTLESPFKMIELRKIWEGESGAKLLDRHGNIHFKPRDPETGKIRMNPTIRFKRDTNLSHTPSPIFPLDDSIEERKKEYIKYMTKEYIDTNISRFAEAVSKYFDIDEVLDMFYEYSNKHSMKACNARYKYATNVVKLTYSKGSFDIIEKEEKFMINKFLNNFNMSVSCHNYDGPGTFEISDDYLRTPMKNSNGQVYIYFIDEPGAKEDAIEIVKEYEGMVK